MFEGIFGRGDIEIEAVFAHAALAVALQGRILCGLITPDHRLSHAFPALGRLGAAASADLPGAVGHRECPGIARCSRPLRIR